MGGYFICCVGHSSRPRGGGGGGLKWNIFEESNCQITLILTDMNSGEGEK